MVEKQMPENQWRTDVLPFDDRPGRQFIVVDGWKEHSGSLWHRRWCDTAFIRRDDQPDCILGYRKEDIDRIMRDGDMDGVDAVIGWLPAEFPSWVLLARTQSLPNTHESGGR